MTSAIRVVYQDAPPEFPAADQHPDAVRYGPIVLADGIVCFVDAIGNEPEASAIEAFLVPPAPPEPTPAEKIATVLGVTVEELKAALANG